jgi:hypothetical protein
VGKLWSRVSVVHNMADVAYELAIVGGELSNDESMAFDQLENLKRIVHEFRGEEVGPWEYHFPTFDEAQAARHQIRQMVLIFQQINIKAVDARSGRDLSS